MLQKAFPFTGSDGFTVLCCRLQLAARTMGERFAVKRNETTHRRPVATTTTHPPDPRRGYMTRRLGYRVFPPSSKQRLFRRLTRSQPRGSFRHGVTASTQLSCTAWVACRFGGVSGWVCGFCFPGVEIFCDCFSRPDGKNAILA